jgi:HK97 family phage major capsid protein
VGDFKQYLFGARKEITIEASREADDAFKKHQVLIRAVLRGDFIVQRAAHIVAIKGIIPES